EHRMYLPSLGLAFGTTVIGYNFISRFFVPIRSRLIILVGILLVLSVSTYIRNMDFRNPITLYTADLRKYPKSERMCLNLALTLNSVGNSEKGGSLLQELAQEYKQNITIQQNWLKFLLIDQKDQETAEKIFHRIQYLIEIGEYNPHTDSMSLFNLARLYQNQGDQERALFLINFLLQYFDYDSLWFSKGHSLVRLGDWDLASESFKNAWKRNPENPPILYWYGKSLVRSGQISAGCQFLEKAAKNKVNMKAAERSRTYMKNYCQSF
ncbi:MAG: tetratricopeptide repeat protein, partial [Bacteroidota bacterium]